MKLVSWNVNGLRAVYRKGNWKDVWELKPDVLCLQEIKADVADLPNEIKEIAGYTAFFNEGSSKKGYSGVALYTNTEPETVEYEIGEERFDVEGRVVTAHFKDFLVSNVYFPNGGQGPERLQYKLDFYDAFLEYIEKIKNKTGKKIIFCGDINTAHEEIDLARPKENEKNTGFLPQERAWIDEVIALGYVDVYRYLHPNKTGAYAYWDLKTRARDRNVGWRIDYFFAEQSLMKNVLRADIHTDIFGSDHCPVSIEVEI
ncbi:exodeoxyribonuclease III [Candidatus Kaiserbacteria bacterium CG10_big_fil_rev_8_21_14_0_10_43_70]|uniref:Exodeoxyribonuclease III n=1 Tax=Candidatus Kaiserbacteria bacterium CG10_big_fil_rev_8_21_14_0_10_43_70 TaxID=1974605 RepID=A0A2H0UIV7_9BACT|nr:MAG: exodeoxyribonuclease III [Candidatus Kaiserbacteria bacterium CG10_big_fil_rev_8_21_14_0_10_43_70]